ncbi:LolA family protein [Candidatus Pelagibacter sp. FZCC0015]|uniref:LolA family protein n=1 Tax=Candidatus Pelagibacter sp. FZCC0015 TaxID=2268451 RepID=UPI0011A5AE12|nr:outer-membrane lipoprotein carrier protein LolA [Candidatus Pelagibacter sp. FZCC0015]
MFRYLLVFFFLTLTFNSNAEIKDKIIKNLNKINNFDFKFEQNINGEMANGNCIIEYPKKIFCEYARSNNKILVSNGKSLVVKTRTSYYRYPLEKTPLNFILDKNFLINKINELEERIVDKNIINFTIIEKGNEINIFFDNQTYDLIGWQNKDIYQNFNVTFISSIRKNRVLKKNLFKIPSQN